MGSPVEGIQGQGLATVWKNSPDFWRFATMQRQDQARAAKALEDEKAMRDALIKENRQFAPGKVWEPFYGEVEDYIQRDVREFSLNNLRRGMSPNTFEGERTRRMGEARKLENKINTFRDIHEKLSERIEKDKNLVPGYYDRKLNDYFFNGRQAKPSAEIDINGIETLFNDSAGYDMAAVGADFMKSLPQQLTEKYRKISSDLGEQFDVRVIKTKLGTKLNADGTVKLDPRTGLPEVQLTDDVTMAALENPYIRNFVVDNLGADVMKPNASLEPVKDLLAPILTPYDQRAMQQQHRQGFKYTEDDKINKTGYTVPEANVAERYDTLYRITHEHDPELLSAILPGLSDNVNIGYEIYGPGESKKAPPRIVVTYPNKNWNKDIDQEQNRMVRKTLSLQTEEDRQAAMEFLNTAMDEKLDAKQRIGENLTNYRKRKRKEFSDQGGIYKDEPVEDDGTGGMYSIQN